jgi:hypothetical protein
MTFKNRKYCSYSFFSKSLRIFPPNLFITLQSCTMDVAAVLQRLTQAQVEEEENLRLCAELNEAYVEEVEERHLCTTIGYPKEGRKQSKL